MKRSSGKVFSKYSKHEKTPKKGGIVPGTGFEPAQPFGCCHLKTVRLPVSPPGLEMFEVSGLKLVTAIPPEAEKQDV